MKLLVLGGTRFVGRAMVEAALERGHRVTLFNRGRTDPEAFPGVERLTGDREESLDALAGRTWDAVIDPSGYAAAHVRASAGALARAAGQYLFVSSISVYPSFGRAGITEDEPLHPPDFDTLRIDWQSYGPMKAACEAVVRDAFADRALVLRPVLLTGPGDPAGRLQYWVRRLAEGGEVLAPGRPDAPARQLDARDLGAWAVRMLERGAGGTFNAAGPPLTMRALLGAAREATGSGARLTWVPDDFLVTRGLTPWVELPFWEHPCDYGTFQIDDRRAAAAGLVARPLADTLRDVVADPAPGEVARALPREREAEILREWGAREEKVQLRSLEPSQPGVLDPNSVLA